MATSLWHQLLQAPSRTQQPEGRPAPRLGPRAHPEPAGPEEHGVNLMGPPPQPHRIIQGPRAALRGIGREVVTQFTANTGPSWAACLGRKEAEPQL